MHGGKHKGCGSEYRGARASYLPSARVQLPPSRVLTRSNMKQKLKTKKKIFLNHKLFIHTVSESPRPEESRRSAQQLTHH